MMQNPCPNDEYLMDFLEDRLSPAQRSQMEVHLAACADCRELVGVCAELILDDDPAAQPSVPPELTRQAVAQVAALRNPQKTRQARPAARRWIDRTKAMWEQFRFRGAAVPVPVRGSSAPPADGLIRRTRQFGDLAVAIEIEPQHADRALIRVLPDEGFKSSEPVRVALIRDGRELASMMLGDAALVFDEIASGIYTLAFVRRGAVAGEYTFELAGAQSPSDHS